MLYININDISYWLGLVVISLPAERCFLFWSSWRSYVCRSFCQSYDMKQHSTKVFRDIVNALGSFIQSLFILPSAGNTSSTSTPAGHTHTHAESFMFLTRIMTDCLMWKSNCVCVSGGSVSASQGSAQGGPGAAGAGGGLITQAAFEYRGTWIPLMNVSVQGSAKAT